MSQQSSGIYWCQCTPTSSSIWQRRIKSTSIMSPIQLQASKKLKINRFLMEMAIFFQGEQISAVFTINAVWHSVKQKIHQHQQEEENLQPKKEMISVKGTVYMGSIYTREAPLKNMFFSKAQIGGTGRGVESFNLKPVQKCIVLLLGKNRSAN